MVIFNVSSHLAQRNILVCQKLVLSVVGVLGDLDENILS